VDNKGYAGNPHCLTKEFFSICLEGLRKNTKIVSQDPGILVEALTEQSKPLPLSEACSIELLLLLWLYSPLLGLGSIFNILILYTVGLL
jgi:hypothetical protein